MRAQNGKTQLFIGNLTDVAAKAMIGRGIAAPELAQSVGREIAIDMCKMYARTHLYIPAAIDITQNLSERNREILNAYERSSPTARAFTSARVEEIAKGYELSEAYVYELLREVHNSVNGKGVRK